MVPMAWTWPTGYGLSPHILQEGRRARPSARGLLYHPDSSPGQTHRCCPAVGRDMASTWSPLLPGRVSPLCCVCGGGLADDARCRSCEAGVFVCRFLLYKVGGYPLRQGLGEKEPRS